MVCDEAYSRGKVSIVPIFQFQKPNESAKIPQQRFAARLGQNSAHVFSFLSLEWAGKSIAFLEKLCVPHLDFVLKGLGRYYGCTWCLRSAKGENEISPNKGLPKIISCAADKRYEPFHPRDGCRRVKCTERRKKKGFFIIPATCKISWLLYASGNWSWEKWKTFILRKDWRGSQQLLREDILILYGKFLRWLYQLEYSSNCKGISCSQKSILQS